MSGSCRDRYAIHQVAHAMRQQMQIAIEAPVTGFISPETGKEPGNIRKIIRPALAAEQPLDKVTVVLSIAEERGERL